MNFPEKIAKQLRRPGEGFFARMICMGMTRKTAAANKWTLSLLNIRISDYVLEIGFGPGLAIREVHRANQLGFTAGIDWSESMVQRARKKNSRSLRNGRLKLQYGDISEGLLFNDGYFDKVFSVQGIYFWPQPQKCVREIHRVLKPGGIVALTIWTEQISSGSRVMQTSVFRHFTAGEICRMLTEAGFYLTRTIIQELRHNQAICVLGLK